MSERKSKPKPKSRPAVGTPPRAAADTGALVVEVVAGTPGKSGDADGPLQTCAFHYPIGLRRYGDSLMVVSYMGRVIQQVDGVWGVTDPVGSSAAAPEYESRAVPVLMAAIPQIPKELAQLMAQYARQFTGTVAIAGNPKSLAIQTAPLWKEHCSVRPPRWRSMKAIRWPVLSC